VARPARPARDPRRPTAGYEKLAPTSTGPPTKQARDQPGLVGDFRKVKQFVYDVAPSRDESKAVKGAMKWIVGLGVSVLAIAIGTQSEALYRTHRPSGPIHARVRGIGRGA
jgi:hypothetical protein